MTPFDVEFDADGKSYTLRYTIGAIVQMENRTNKPFTVLAEDMQDIRKLRIGDVREMLYAGLKHHHPKLTAEEAGELILSAGGLPVVLPKVAEAIAAAFPAPQEAAPQGDGDPQTATAERSGANH